jgi:autotransporter-associated beta strand protein
MHYSFHTPSDKVVAQRTSLQRQAVLGLPTLIVALALLAPAGFAASTNTWVGGSGNSFSTLANWTYSSGGGPVASGDSLLFLGAGSLTPNNDLSGATFSGIGFNGSALYTVGGNAFTLASGGSISNGTAVMQTLNNNITLSGSGGILNPMVGSANCGLTLGGSISGSANLTKSGGSGSVLTLSGLNTFSGALNLNSGTVNFTTPPNPAGANLGNPSAINFGGNSTTTLVPSSTAGSVTISYPTLTVNGTSTAMFKSGAAAGTTFEIAAKVTGSGNCKQNSPTTTGAIVRFSNDGNDFTGTFGMAAGIVEFTSVANAGAASALGAGSGAYVIGNSSSAATFRYVGSGSAATTRSIDWQGTAGGLTLESSGSGSVQFLGTGNFKSGNGTNVLTLRGTSTGANTLAQPINDYSTTATTTLSKSDTGTWLLSGANTFSGPTTINAGTLQLSGSGTLGSSAGALTLSGGTLDLGGTSQTKAAVTLSGASALQNGTLSGASFSATLSSGTALVSANLAGSAASLSLSGAGTLALFGANTYGGGTTIGSAGSLLLTSDAGLGNASGGLTFNASGILAATNNAAGVNTPVTIGAARTITVNSGVTANFFTPDTNNLIVAAKITGPGSVTRKSSGYSLGVVRFSNDTSDYTGDFTAGYGNIEFTSVAEQGTPSSLGAGTAGSRGQISLNNGSSSGTLRYVGTGDRTTHRPLIWTGAAGYTLDASGSGSVQYLAADNLRSGAGGSVTLSLRGISTGPNTLAQPITDLNGTTTLIKNDAGTWALTGVNSHTGPTTISGGTLLVNGSLAGSGPVCVQTNATLAGNGIIAGVVTVNAGGTLAPGAGANTLGTLTLQASPTLNGALAMDVRKSLTGLTSDQLALGANNLAFGGALIITASGDPLTAGDSFQLFTAASYSGSFTNVTVPDLGTGLTWDTSTLAVDGTLRVRSLGSVPAVAVIPASTNVECSGAVTFSTTSTGSPAPTFQWFDNSGNAIPNATAATLTLTNVHAAQNGSWTVVASNSLGTSTNSAVLAVSDSTPPTITCPSYIAIVTTDPVGANVSFSVTATDTCDSAPTAVSTPASGSFFAAGTNTVVSTATDSSGNTNTCSFLVVVDRAPVVQTNLNAYVAQDKTLTLDLSNLLSMITDLDNDVLSVAQTDAASTNGGSVILTSTNVIYQPVAGFTGMDLMNYVVADGRGGLATNAVVLNVLSTNEFIVAVSPATTNAECASSVSFTAETAATPPVSFQWYDNAGNPIAEATSATLTLANVHTAQNGSWTVVMANAFAQVTNSVSLNVVDTTGPAITLKGAEPMVVKAGSQFADPGATALDACAGPVTVTASGSVDANVPGTYTLTYTADDGSGNVSHATRTVTVLDTTPPVIVYAFTNLNLSNSTTNCQALLPDLTGTNYFIAVGTDGSSVTVTQSPPAETWLSLGTNLVVLTAVDASGNAISSTNTVVVADTTPPVLTLLGANPLTNECHVSFTDPGAVAEDSCSGVVSLTTNGLVNADVLGTYTLQYVAADASGNTITNTRTIYVVDTTAPVITCPSDMLIVTTEPIGANVSFTVTATDACDSAPRVVSSPASGSFFVAGNNVVVSTATDRSGNINTCSFLVVVDRAPVVQTNLTAYLLQNQTLTFSSGQLLAVARDLDNDPLSVASVDASSTHGGLVKLTSTALTYQPAIDFVGADQFRYTISDRRGGFATNTVVVYVVSSTGLSPNVIYGPVLTNGQFVVRFAGIPGYTYTLEATESLLHPVWTKVVNLTASPTAEDAGQGSFEFRDDSSAADRKFYRTVYPSY